jgi:hypothetical protein
VITFIKQVLFYHNHKLDLSHIASDGLKISGFTPNPSIASIVNIDKAVFVNSRFILSELDPHTSMCKGLYRKRNAPLFFRTNRWVIPFFYTPKEIVSDEIREINLMSFSAEPKEARKLENINL